jgi:pyruvate/2-oxoglutarate dehydrogenase complex dihydrolipoamide dehydrogenase (E3) component
MARSKNQSGNSWLSLARQHSINTVSAVRQREDFSGVDDRNPTLDFLFVQKCRFVSSHELELAPRNTSNILPWNTRVSTNSSVLVTSKKFLIATGASPIVPEHLQRAARKAGVAVHTYRSVLQPPRSEDDALESIWNMTATSTNGNFTKQIVIAGGGPTACELGQSLARLGGSTLNITIVAPELLPNEDVTLRRAAMQLLTNDEITLRLGSRVTDVSKGDDSVRHVELDNGRLFIPVDALLLCLGRSPGISLSTLNLEAANVQWNPDHGVEVHKASLRSKSAPHVYACGDCCDAVRNRRAAHAAWTGFHAARNTILPFWLQMGSKAVHPTVPGVTYTDPELASVGLSYVECVRRYGTNGFNCLNVSEEGMDRGDMERLERPVIGFVELRATKISGRVLGMTACGPAAAELVNEIGLVITSGLTVRDIARCIHSYPSHGYLMHRIALALATNNIYGLLSACGPLGSLLGGIGRLGWHVSSSAKSRRIWRRRQARSMREWEADGSRRAILISDSSDGVVQKDNLEAGNVQLLSYLEAYADESLLPGAMAVHHYRALLSDKQSWQSPGLLDMENMAGWVQRKPK